MPAGAERTIFIDRDALCFPTILSYLRSRVVYFKLMHQGDGGGEVEKEMSIVYLRRLVDEASFYALTELQELVQAEMQRREEAAEATAAAASAKAATKPEEEYEYKRISPLHLDCHFKEGYAFVSTFEDDETPTCGMGSSGRRIETFWRNGHCSSCHIRMELEKFIRHATYVRLTRVVVRRARSQTPVQTGQDHPPSIPLPLPV